MADNECEAGPSSTSRGAEITTGRETSTTANRRGMFEQTFAEKVAEKRRRELAAKQRLSKKIVPDGPQEEVENQIDVDAAAAETPLRSNIAENSEGATVSLATPTGKEFTKEEATKVVSAILSSDDGVSAYQLIEFPDYQARIRGGTCRSPRDTRALDGFYALCPANSLQRTGMVVCMYVRGGGCPLDKAIFRYNPAAGGTSTFKSHTEIHTKTYNQKTLDTSIPLATKKIIIAGAAKAVVQDLVPFDFIEGSGMQEFAMACFKAGQASSAMRNFDISKAMPAPATVTKAVDELANSARTAFKNENLENAQMFGGALTTDGLKHKPTGKKFYDLSMMYFEILGEGSIQGACLKLVSRVLLLEEHTAHTESAEAISVTLSSALRKRYNVELSKMLSNFTLVTDRASTLPVVAGASSSAAKCAYQEKWLFCMPHYLNTVMKRSIDACKTTADDNMKRIAADLSRAKEIVRVFKAGDWQKELGDGNKLIQEVTTRFSTTFYVVERFLESLSDIERIMFSPQHNHDGARRNFDGICVEKCPETAAITGAPALSAIVKVFDCIVMVQTRLEADLQPTIHLVLPYVELIRGQLEKLFAPSSTESVYTKSLAKVVHSEVLSMTEHPLHAAACLLVPSLRNLEFITDVAKRERLRQSGLAQLRRLMAKTYSRRKKVEEKDVAGMDCPVVRELTPAKRKRDARNSVLSLKSMSDTNGGPKQGEDELALYFATSTPVELFEDQFDIDDAMAAPTFWLRQRTVYPELHEVAMRLFATPASSCTSERVFSVVARTLTPDRSRMTPENLSNIVISRSALSRGVQLQM